MEIWILLIYDEQVFADLTIAEIYYNCDKK
jgi:hypothetical protein